MTGISAQCNCKCNFHLGKPVGTPVPLYQKGINYDNSPTIINGRVEYRCMYNYIIRSGDKRPFTIVELKLIFTESYMSSYIGLQYRTRDNKTFYLSYPDTNVPNQVCIAFYVFFFLVQ